MFLGPKKLFGIPLKVLNQVIGWFQTICKIFGTPAPSATRCTAGGSMAVSNKPMLTQYNIKLGLIL